MKLNRPFICLIVIVFAMSGCKQKALDVATNSKQTATPTVAPTVEPFPRTEDPAADLKAVFARFRNVKAFSQTSEGSKVKISYIAPDRYSIQSSIVTTITIGKDSYMKMGDSWSKMKEGFGSSMKDFHETFSEKTFNGLKDIKFSSVQNVKGVNTRVYSFKGFRKTAESDYTATLWVNTENGLPHILAFVYAKSDPTEDTYSYDGIVIEPPIVAK